MRFEIFFTAVKTFLECFRNTPQVYDGNMAVIHDLIFLWLAAAMRKKNNFKEMIQQPLIKSNFRYSTFNN